MRKKQMNKISGWIVALSTLLTTQYALARDIEYKEEEVSVRVTSGEPTQIRFPGLITGGYQKSFSAINLERKDSDLIVFPNEKIDENGEAIVVRLQDGRSYSLRFQKSTIESPRDDVVKIRDRRGSILDSREDDSAPAYKEVPNGYAPPSQAAGLMRQLILVTEFNKRDIPGYQVSDQYSGETVLNDGTLHATIDRIYIGPNYWGYVLKVKNQLDVAQKLNPATFRLDGTIFVSYENQELAARPMDVEQQIAKKDGSYIYIVTKAR